MSRGHGGSRRRSYGPRQKDLRDRRALEPSIDLDGPASWPRGGAWESNSSRTGGQASDSDRHQPGGAA